MIVGRQNSTINKKERENKTKQNKTMDPQEILHTLGVPRIPKEDLKEELAKYKAESKRWEDMCESITLERDGLAEDIDARVWQSREDFDEIEELKEKITCLESDSHNEISMAEHEELKEELAKYKEAESYLLVQSNPDAFIWKVREVKADLKELKEEVKELKAQNEKLFKFTIGGGEASEVEKIITEKMTKEFIVENHEHWGEIGLFQEESEEAENKDLQKQVEELKKVVLRWQEKADFNLTDSDSSEEEDEELKPEPGKVSQ